VVYAPEKSAFVWKIKQLGGGRDYLMRAHFGLPSVKSGMSADTFVCPIAEQKTSSISGRQYRSNSRFHTLQYQVFKSGT
jgi:hypothetical protein